MKPFLTASKLFAVLHPVRWIFIFGLIGTLSALVIAAAVKNPVSSASLSSVQPAMITAYHYFAPERLESFSGYTFDLQPELIHFLDQMEASLCVKSADQELSKRVNDYTQFTNPAIVTFEVYTIKLGDNYWKIAKNRGYTIDSIVGCNPHLEKVICYNGQRILLPSRGGSLHQVKQEETLETIALDYTVAPELVSQANMIDSEWGVLPGMWIFIPGGKPRYLTGDMHKQYTKRALFRSPLAGRYTSFVGKRIHPVLKFSKFHNGVDIACPMNTWVGASAAGTVIAAGWGDAIGKFVKIDHHNGYITVYGHLNTLLVRQGQNVKKGQLIARSGNTGRTTGPHLHYTIYDRGRVVDPMDFLW